MPLPPLGIFDGVAAGAATSFESIATASGTGSSGTISFTSIPTDYTHLQIRGLNNDSTGYFVYMQFNSDTGSNYTIHQLYGNGSSAAAYGGASSSYIYAGVAGYGGSAYVAPLIIDILDYKNTNKYKTCRMLTGFDSNGTYTGYVQFNSGLWMNTNAITRIDLKMTGNFSTTATFALYGIKSA
jgi:NAD(P)H-dependent flavin oxidoreductase YrpB (nitropropane dioxygenase family)